MSSSEEQLAFVVRVLALGDGFNLYGDLWDSIWWRTDDEYAPVTFMVNCNDLFYWACSDCERLGTQADIDGLTTAVGDVREALGVARGEWPRDTSTNDMAVWSELFNAHYNAGSTGAQLWCARKRGMRPQRPCLKYMRPEVLALFLACGPERDRKDEG